MASAAGKKKQKMKGKTLNLNEFLADENGQASGPGQSYVLANKPVNWADEVESEEVDADVMPYGYGAPLRNVNRASLPTAPRAARGPDVDMDKIPSRPPFTAFLGNLPYDISREDIEQFFRQLRVSNIRLPNDKGRMKGFGYAEFEDRQSLVDALTLNDTQMRGRKIRVDLAEQSQPGNDSGFGGERRGDDGEDRTLGDWRRRDDKPFDDRGSRDDSRGGGGFDRYERREDDRYGDRNRGYGDRDRGFSDRDRGRDFGDRDRGYGGDRDRGFGGDRNRGYGDRDRDRGYGDRDRDRGYGGDRDRDRDRGYGGDRDRGYDRYGGDRDRGRFGGDRDRDRGRYGGDRYDDRGGRFGGDRGGDRYGGDRGGDRFGDRRGYDDDRRSFGTGFRDRDRNGYRDDRYGGPRDRPDDRYSRDETDARGPPRGPEDQGEQDGPGESAGGGRRRLNLKPRSKPIEQVGATEQSSSIFGGAKPVDTAAKEREIEDRLRKQQEQEFERQEQEKEKRDEMERRRTSSSTSDKSKPRRGSDASLESERTTRKERKSSSSSGKGIRTVAPPPGAGSARVRHDSQMSDSEEVFEEDKPAVKTPPPRKEEAPPKLVPAPVPEENIWEKRKTSQHSHKEPSGPPPKKTEDQSSHQESRGSSTSQPQKSPQPAPAPKENAWSKGKPVDLVPAEPPRENIWAKRKQEAEKERKRQESMSSTHSQEAVSGNELEGDRTDSDHRTSTEHSPSERISQPRPRKSEEDTEGSFSGGHWGKKRGGGTGGPAGRGRGGERGRGRGERGRGRGDRSSRGGARGSSSREEKPLPKSIDEMPKYEEPKKKDWSDHNKFAGLLDDEGDEDQYSDD